MISPSQMAVYARFDGDADQFARFGTAAEQALMPDGVWEAVDRIRDGLARVRSGVAAPEYAARVEAEGARELADPAARDMLMRLVDADVRRHGSAADESSKPTNARVD